jgi:hypothetical protein
MSSKPVAVLISDVHYNVTTLPVANTAMKAALAKAEELKVPLVDAGDLLDTKAILRAECVNALIDLFSKSSTRIVLLVGNHTLINEKGKEHVLNFLRPHCDIIDSPMWDEELQSWLIPYESNSQTLQKTLSDIPGGSRLIMHTGVQSAFMGHYIQDKSSLPKESYANYRVVSGHYHRAQDIKCGRPRKGAVGLFTYIGNPYTLSFGEAQDGSKGFGVLMSDGTLERIPTNLRKHVIIEETVGEFKEVPKLATDDLLWLKVRGPKSELSKLNKKALGARYIGHSNFKLDLIPTDSNVSQPPQKTTEPELLDHLISDLAESEEFKVYLKELWREII